VRIGEIEVVPILDAEGTFATVDEVFSPVEAALKADAARRFPANFFPAWCSSTPSGERGSRSSSKCCSERSALGRRAGRVVSLPIESAPLRRSELRSPPEPTLHRTTAGNLNILSG
jgi:hypothetical protein